MNKEIYMYMKSTMARKDLWWSVGGRLAFYGAGCSFVECESEFVAIMSIV